MKNRLSLSGLCALLLLLGSLGSCTTTRETEVEDELSDFRSWVTRETSQLATRTEEDWKRAKQDFKTRTTELDLKQEKFSDELKKEYSQLKQEFNKADESYMSSRSEAQMAEWDRNLLGSYADKSTINESNVREAYLAFMQNVRAQKSEWTNKEWDMAKMVLQSLNDRKSELTSDIDTDSEVKIKALQMEFRTLETAADISGN
ncbi:hypothetical protein MKJ04_16155 [Pontibacter sp. E15-1]|uniref:hypothetical protein n=1 Tax=Pontibacter sp. E15-1 TaxID=2919918 RepID=UPI001F4FD1C1|nr:hypothetical protein [Pontibacter sp. E15-1]MCJ8166380.1 hypothetical protein [Pontibacter sp. E15-1]